MTATIGIMILFPIIFGFPWIIIIFWSLFCALFLFVLHGMVAPMLKRRIAITVDGYQGVAEILTIQLFPEFQQQYNTTDIFATILFNIKITGKEPYQLEKKERINPTLFKNFTVGALFPLHIDKNNPKEVIFLFEEIRG